MSYVVSKDEILSMSFFENAEKQVQFFLQTKRLTYVMK